MKIKTVILMSILSFLGLFGCKSNKPSYPQDKIATNDGGEITLTFFKHASLSIEVDGRYIYVDPVDSYADYARLPKADVVLVTHSHYDHFDRAAIDKLSTRETIVVCDKVSAEAFDFDCVVMTPGATANPIEGVAVEAVPAYNISEGHLDFHPKSREDCGYIVTIGGSRIYIAGDTENNEDVKSVKSIDVAFLPVNQPYTMTVEQAVDAVKTIKPSVFYPYHYGEVEEKTDIDRLVRELDGVTEVRVRPME
ncbi:MAG: MBL fold metallo-hydrolase [Alistipes sp.]|nr:MBL fold metallo-hydrolase [Alistipes sp.]